MSCQDIIYHQKGFCTKCWPELKFVPENICEICGHVFDFPLAEEKPICIKCQSEKPHFDCARSIWIYNQLTRKLVLKLKYADQIDLAKYFTHYFLMLGEEFLGDVDMICPVPLHWQRQWKRGYNQAALLAKWLSFYLSHSPYDTKEIFLVQDLLKRVKKTDSQGHYSVQKRQENIKNAFQVSEKYQASLKGKTVLLVDDVYTTGATANETAKTLVQAGAEKVKVLTLMRVELKLS